MALVLAKTFINAVILVFLTLLFIVIFKPSFYFARQGLFYKSFDICARAELRAYYAGTSLAICYLLKFNDTRTALQFIAVVLGGTCFCRLIGYYDDGVDPDPSLRWQMHRMFLAEAVGFLTAVGFMHYSRDAKLVEKRGIRNRES